MALGLITPTAGAVELFGRDPMRDGARALEGVAGFVEAPRFYPYLSAQKNLELLAALDGDGAGGRIGEVLETVELAPRARHKVGGYSHGMRQRLGIAAALLRRPRLLILDEPATGLDPAGMRDMRSLIRRLADGGMTVLLSCHQLPEVQELCDRVAIVDRGRVVYEGALVGPAPPGRHALPRYAPPMTRARSRCPRPAGIGRAPPEGLEFQAQERDVGEVSLALGRSGIAILALTPQLASLEDLFFRLTEGASEDGPGGHGAVNGNAVPAGAVIDPGAAGRGREPS